MGEHQNTINQALKPVHNTEISTEANNSQTVSNPRSLNLSALGQKRLTTKPNFDFEGNKFTNQSNITQLPALETPTTIRRMPTKPEFAFKTSLKPKAFPDLNDDLLRSMPKQNESKKQLTYTAKPRIDYARHSKSQLAQLDQAWSEESSPRQDRKKESPPQILEAPEDQSSSNKPSSVNEETEEEQDESDEVKPKMQMQKIAPRQQKTNKRRQPSQTAG